jgi:hypothetical protein
MTNRNTAGLQPTASGWGVVFLTPSVTADRLRTRRTSWMLQPELLLRTSITLSESRSVQFVHAVHTPRELSSFHTIACTQQKYVMSKRNTRRDAMLQTVHLRTGWLLLQIMQVLLSQYLHKTRLLSRHLVGTRCFHVFRQ